MTKIGHLAWLRITVLAAFAIFFAWLVFTQSFAAYFAGFAPETALWLQPRQPLALTNLADRTFNHLSSLPPSSQSASEQTSEWQENSSAESSGSAEKLASVASQSEKIDQTGTVERSLAAHDSNATNDPLHPVVPPATATEVRAWAKSALMHDPLNARALRILGQLAAANKDYDDASKFMYAAAQLSLHESVAVYWSMFEAAKAKNYKAVTYYADVLLRTLPQLNKYVEPVLAKIAEDQGSDGSLQTVLENNPPWRGQFLAELPNNVEDARTPLSLLLALRTSSAPPKTAEVAPYINFLVGRSFYDLAYYTWLQFLPVDELHEAGLLFNGRFDMAPSGLPFDWNLTSGSGVTMGIVPNPDGNGKHALQVDFAYGRVDYDSVGQLVMLAPGTYTFKGQYKGQLIGPRGLKWRVVCARGPVVGESPMIIGTMPNWRDTAFNFTVPATSCPAQYVRLDLDARMASEQLISGSILFDDLQILRVENAS